MKNILEKIKWENNKAVIKIIDSIVSNDSYIYIHMVDIRDIHSAIHIKVREAMDVY